jgi:hypothetical protein
MRRRDFILFAINRIGARVPAFGSQQKTDEGTRHNSPAHVARAGPRGD